MILPRRVLLWIGVAGAVTAATGCNKEYYRGWNEWGNAEDTPIVRGKQAE